MSIKCFMKDHAGKDWLDYETDEEEDTLLESFAEFIVFAMLVLSLIVLFFVVL